MQTKSNIAQGYIEQRRHLQFKTYGIPLRQMLVSAELYELKVTSDDMKHNNMKLSKLYERSVC